jgi:hypothetical protein
MRRFIIATIFCRPVSGKLLRSEGASENSPQFQLRVNATKKQSPAGATDKTVAENSAAPPGLADFYRIKPAVETAGYSHPSPRDCAANPANQRELNPQKSAPSAS